MAQSTIRWIILSGAAAGAMATVAGWRGAELAGGEPFEEAQIFFELNTTDNDMGVQVFIDNDEWRYVNLYAPNGRHLLQIKDKGPLAELGITELRFESGEPSPAEVLDVFPEGVYTFRGRTIEGDSLESTAELSHDFLPAPEFTPADGEIIDPNNAVVVWNAPGAGRVQIIIENEELGHFFDVIVSDASGSLDVPPQFLQPGVEYDIEVLAISENGNRTIAESNFETQE
jgi:hypothetical protein